VTDFSQLPEFLQSLWCLAESAQPSGLIRLVFTSIPISARLLRARDFTAYIHVVADNNKNCPRARSPGSPRRDRAEFQTSQTGKTCVGSIRVGTVVRHGCSLAYLVPVDTRARLGKRTRWTRGSILDAPVHPRLAVAQIFLRESTLCMYLYYTGKKKRKKWPNLRGRKQNLGVYTF
jgi:hypothetical protein